MKIGQAFSCKFALLVGRKPGTILFESSQEKDVECMIFNIEPPVVSILMNRKSYHALESSAEMGIRHGTITLFDRLK